MRYKSAHAPFGKVRELPLDLKPGYQFWMQILIAALHTGMIK
jgi:hypothetical protein